MAMDMATGKGGVNLKADGGKYFHLKGNLLKCNRAAVLPCCGYKNNCSTATPNNSSTIFD
jgi:hypothetical protein